MDKVEVSKDIMGGLPVFKGTRVPISFVLASIDKGISMERIVESYPFLTQEHIVSAREYTKEMNK